MSVRLTAREKEKKDLFFRKINLALVEFEKKNIEISNFILLFKYPSSCVTQNNKHVHIFNFVCMLKPTNKRNKNFCNSFLWKPCSYLLWAKFCNSFGRKPCSYLLAQIKLELSPPSFLQKQGMPFTHCLCFNLHLGHHIIVPLLIAFPLLSCIDKWAIMGKYSFFRAWYIAALVSNNPGDFFADLLESKLKPSPT